MLKYYLYVIARKILLRMSTRRAYVIASFLGKLSYYINHGGREQVYANLAVVFPEKSKKELKPVVLKNFINFTKYLVDFLRAQKLNSSFLQQRVRFFNCSVLDDLRYRKQNFILVTAHIGNWELGGGVLSLLGFNMAAVAKPHRNQSTNRFFDKQRDFMSMDIIPLGIAVRRCFKVLKAGKVLALLGDKEFGDGGFKLKMCSSQACIPKGPASLAMKFNLPIIPAFMLRNCEDNYDFFVESAISVTDEYGHERTEENIAKDYASVIEKYIKKYPEQWFMFEPYFNV